MARHLGLVGVHLRERVARGGGRHGKGPQAQREDLFQAGCLGLMEAAAHYDPRRHGAFAAYALPRIRRAVHAALLAEGSVVRVPYGAASRRSRKRPARTETVRLSRDDRLAAPEPSIESPAGAGAGRTLSIRHALRARFLLAVERAVKVLAGEHRRPAEAAEIFARVSGERVLVNDPGCRTPVRQLARELGISSGQVTVYEQRILARAREEMAADAQVGLLVRFAREDAAGFDAWIDERRRRRLNLAELRAFDRRFAALDRDQRAGALYALIERTCPCVPRIARNLYRLTLSLS
ncbi:MAG: sigma-70 family RNA polymerase sigma factor [Phycisphaerae bacterium]